MATTRGRVRDVGWRSPWSCSPSRRATRSSPDCGAWSSRISSVHRGDGRMHVLAVLAVDRIGGSTGSSRSLRALREQAGRRRHPAPCTAVAAVSSLLVFLAVQWWAAWYPGAEPGGGGYVAAAHPVHEDERTACSPPVVQHRALALRPWPWILVGAVRRRQLSRPRQPRARLRGRWSTSSLAAAGLMLAAFAART